MTAPQMTVLSNLYHTDGQLWISGSRLRAARRLEDLGYAECVEAQWHRVTATGADAFLRLRAQEDTPQGAAARRILERQAA